jgi:hypothetical protein
MFYPILVYGQLSQIDNRYKATEAIHIIADTAYNYYCSKHTYLDFKIPEDLEYRLESSESYFEVKVKDKQCIITGISIRFKGATVTGVLNTKGEIKITYKDSENDISAKLKRYIGKTDEFIIKNMGAPDDESSDPFEGDDVKRLGYYIKDKNEYGVLNKVKLVYFKLKLNDKGVWICKGYSIQDAF